MYRVSIHEALIATLAYGDIFDYPLTRQELIYWFLYYPVRTTDIPKGIGLRVKHEKALWQLGKWVIARKAGRWLSLVPTIQLVGVTGGLAMNNAEKKDDIDLFFIVADGTLWVSRMLATILMDILGLRRHPKDQRVANKVCLNMFMTEHATGLLRAERDCFSAHEVLQMEPLFVRGETYAKFLKANRWAKKYLPNAWEERIKSKKLIVNRIHRANFLFRIFEPFTKIIQLRYMRKHRTNEIISDTTLRFHPRDARVWIKRKFALRLAHYGIPLDKVFYAS